MLSELEKEFDKVRMTLTIFKCALLLFHRGLGLLLIDCN